MKLIAIAVLGLLASPAAAQPSRPVILDSITYQTGPCYGVCPVYRVKVNANGTGVYEGINVTAVTGVRGSGSRRTSIAPSPGSSRRSGPRGLVSYNGAIAA